MSGEAQEELLYQSERTRVTRVLDAGAPVIRKEFLGPDAPRRLRRERAALERLAGVPGVAQLGPQTSGHLLLQDVRGAPLPAAGRLGVSELLRLAPALTAAVAEVHARG